MRLSGPAASVRVRAWSFDEFTAVVRRYQDMVYSLAYHFLDNVGEAEELAQEVFVELFRKRPVLESDEHLKHWLRRTTCHRAIDWLRQRARAKSVPLDELPAAPEQAAEQDPWLQARLRRAIASLPPKRRLVLILRYQEGLTAEEIANLLDMPASTIRAQLARTLAWLRLKLQVHRREGHP